MIASQRKGRERQGGQLPFLAFGLGAFVAVFTLVTAVPLHADTFYSGAAVHSDGSVYSWGVTSACSMSSHTTHMSSTLTSPKGRQASNSANDGCSSRVDLYLAFDSTDTGTYTVVSYSWAFCPVLGRWFWNGCQSQGSAAVSCDFAISGAPAPATCDNKTVNSTTYQAAGIPTYCQVYEGGSTLTFVTDKVKVEADYNDSNTDFTGAPTLHAAYWVTSSGGTITPQFTLVFNGGASEQSHDKTNTVTCK